MCVDVPQASKKRPNVAASAAAAQPRLFAFIQNRNWAAVGLEAMVRRDGVWEALQGLALNASKH